MCISLLPSDTGNSLSSLTVKYMGVGGGREGLELSSVVPQLTFQSTMFFSKVKSYIDRKA